MKHEIIFVPFKAHSLPRKMMKLRTYSFYRLSREGCLVSRDESLISREERLSLEARVTSRKREGGNLLLSSTVSLTR